MRRLNQFMQHTTRKEAQMRDLKLLTWCSLNLLSFYYSKSQHHLDECGCCVSQKLEQSKALLRGTMYLILPEKQVEVVKYTIKYMTLTEQWNTEDYDAFVFQVIFPNS